MDEISRELDEKLVRKYNYKAFMYTEYPHKRYWSQPFDSGQMRGALKSLFYFQKDAPILLYVHMPYCHKQCYFCTCRVEISLDYDDVKNYLNILYREIDLYREFFDANSITPNFKEIHLGGGSPTYIQPREFEQLMARLRSVADPANLAEFSIEVDPRRVKKDRLKYYHEKGINRISFGVQDFDLEVQKAVNRVQPAELTAKLLTPEIRRLFKNGINFDIICGLPRQNRDSIRKTMRKVVEIAPDRICLNYLDFAPQFNPHQLLMPLAEIPDGYDRKLLFLEALEILSESGYVRTGYDHFAKPTDDVAKAMEKKQMIWNSLGTTPGRCGDIIGIGVHSYSKLGPYYYAQNFYELSRYEAALNSGDFPVFRGHHLSRDDVIRRRIIQQLRSYFLLDCREIEAAYDIDFMDYFREEMGELDPFLHDGIVEFSDNKIRVTEIGQQFASLVCRCFDVYIRKEAPDTPANYPQFAHLEKVLDQHGEF